MIDFYFCTYCEGQKLSEKDLLEHIEKVHVSRFEADTIPVSCSECKLRFRTTEYVDFIKHCCSSGHDPQKASFEWNDFLVKEESRLRDIFQIGVKIRQESLPHDNAIAIKTETDKDLESREVLDHESSTWGIPWYDEDSIGELSNEKSIESQTVKEFKKSDAEESFNFDVSLDEQLMADADNLEADEGSDAKTIQPEIEFSKVSPDKTCPICYKTSFKNRASMRRHVQRIHFESKVECPVFSCKLLLMRDNIQHHFVKYHPSNSETLIQKAIEHLNSYLDAPRANARQGKKKAIKRTKKEQIPDGGLSCEVCQRNGFMTRSNLRTHQIRNHEKPRIICPIQKCQTPLISENLRYHFKTKHPTEGDQMNRAIKTLESMEDLTRKKHVPTGHDAEKNSIASIIQQSKWRTAESFKSGLVCDICKLNGFKNPVTLANHKLRLHVEEEQCPGCDVRMKPRYLVLHVKKYHAHSNK